MPSKEPRCIYGMHDPDGEKTMKEEETLGWILFVERIFANPNETHGRDYGEWATEGYGIITRFQYDWFPGGTIPAPAKYDDFAQRIGNYVADSQGCITAPWATAKKTQLKTRPRMVLSGPYLPGSSGSRRDTLPGRW